MYLSIGTNFIECKKCDRIIVFCLYYHFLIGVLCSQYFLWTLVEGNEGSSLMGLVLDFETKVVIRSMILDLHVYTHTQCILVYCTFGIYRALRLSDPRTTGPSDCRTLGLLGTWSLGTLGLMGGYRRILCTNHCFPRGRTAGKSNFPVYLNIPFTYSLWCDLSCLGWKSSKKMIPQYDKTNKMTFAHR